MSQPVTLERWLARGPRGDAAAAVALLSGLVALFVWRGEAGPGPDREWVSVNSVESDLTLVTSSATFRLAGVVADESWRSRAREAIQSECVQSPLLLTREDPMRSGDGPVPVYAYLPNGRMLNEWLIERGLARADERGGYALGEWFLRLESVSRQRKRGAWAER